MSYPVQDGAGQCRVKTGPLAGFGALNYKKVYLNPSFKAFSTLN
jgi:hypothetical protein